MSSRRWPAALTDPRTALAVVVVTTVVCGAATLVAADAVAASVTGTATVDNPSRPPAAVCADRETTPGAFDPCGAPETVTVDRAAHAATAVRQLLPGTLLAVGAAWLLFTAAFAAAGSVRAVGARTAWAVAPLAAPAVFRLLTVPETAAARSWPAGLDALTLAARRTATLAGDPTATVVGLAALGAAGAVLYAVGAGEGVWWGPLAAVLAPATLAVGPTLGVATPRSLGVGLTVVAVGLPAAFAPRRLVGLATTVAATDVDATTTAVGRPITVTRVVGLALLTAGSLLARLPAYLL